MTEKLLFGTGGDTLLSSLSSAKSCESVGRRFYDVLDAGDFVLSLLELPRTDDTGFFAAAKSTAKAMLDSDEAPVEPSKVATFLAARLEEHTRAYREYKAGFLLACPKYSSALLLSPKAVEEKAELVKAARSVKDLQPVMQQQLQQQLDAFMQQQQQQQQQQRGSHLPSSSTWASPPAPASAPAPAAASKSSKRKEKQVERQKKALRAELMQEMQGGAPIGAAPSAPPSLPSSPPPAPASAGPIHAFNPNPLMGPKVTAFPAGPELRKWTQENGNKCFAFWRMGRCRHGEACQFEHAPNQELRPFQQPAP